MYMLKKETNTVIIFNYNGSEHSLKSNVTKRNNKKIAFQQNKKNVQQLSEQT